MSFYIKLTTIAGVTASGEIKAVSLSGHRNLGEAIKCGRSAKIHEGMIVTHHTSDNSGKFSEETFNNHDKKWVIDTDNAILIEDSLECIGM